MVRSLWLGRLPRSSQEILATRNNAYLHSPVELADTILNQQTVEVSTSGKNMEQEIALLTDKVTIRTTELEAMKNKVTEISSHRRWSRNRSAVQVEIEYVGTIIISRMLQKNVQNLAHIRKI